MVFERYCKGIESIYFLIVRLQSFCVFPLASNLCEGVFRRQGLWKRKRMRGDWLCTYLCPTDWKRWALTFSTPAYPGRIKSLVLSELAQLCDHPEKHTRMPEVSLCSCPLRERLVSDHLSQHFQVENPKKKKESHLIFHTEYVFITEKSGTTEQNDDKMCL